MWNNLLRKLWNRKLRFLWNEINPHAARRISHCEAIFHARRAFHKSWKDLFRWKKTIPKNSLFSGGATQTWTGDKGVADPCLTTWLWRRIFEFKIKETHLLHLFDFWSGRRDSNSRRSPWQGDALPLSHSRIYCLKKLMVPPGGIEPPTQGFSVPCSTDWATEAYL